MLNWNKDGKETKIIELHLVKPSVSVLRKQLELDLIELVERYQAQGLDIEWIAVDLCEGVNASVKLKRIESDG